jgi:hypothetical protein
MEKRPRIYIWGNSIILASLKVSLLSDPQNEVTTLTPPLPDAMELANLNPEVIIFDLEAARPKAAFALLEANPDLILMGVSPDSNLVKVWSGCQLQELSTQDLLKVMNQQLKVSAALE